MEEQVKRAIKALVDRGWITVNEHLTEEALARAFIDEFMQMPLKSYIEFLISRK